MLETLKGKKTYAVAAIFAAVEFLRVLGYLTDEAAKSIQAALIAAGAMTMRSAIAEIHPEGEKPAATGGGSKIITTSAPISQQQTDWIRTLLVGVVGALAGSQFTPQPVDPVIIEIEKPSDPAKEPPTKKEKPQKLEFSDTSFVYFQPSPKLAGPSEVSVGELVEITSDAPADAAVMFDAISPDDLDFRTYEDGRVFVCSSCCNGGKIVVSCITIQLVTGKIKATKTRHTVTVIDPTPPVQPTATLEATPDKISKGQSSILNWLTSGANTIKLQGVPVAPSGTQTVSPDKSTSYLLEAANGPAIAAAQRLVTVTDLPPPSPPPIAELGFRIMVIEDLLERPKLPPEQLNIILSTAPGSFLQFVNKNAVRDSRGYADIRYVGTMDDLSEDKPYWKAAYELPRTSLPWLIASNGKRGYSGPLPKTLSEALAIVQPLIGGE